MKLSRVYFTNIIKSLAIAFLALLVLFVSFTSEGEATAGILKQINFQGKVVNTNGTNVANGDYNFLFCIYTTASPSTACTAGANNDAVWRESKTISVADGVFQTLLGDTTTFPGSVDFNSDNIYVGVNFNSDGQMTPLVRFSAVPYAFNADKIHGLSVTDTTGTFTLANGKTFTMNNTLTFAGTDSTTITFQGTDTYVGRATTDTLTNKTIGSTGLIFSGATTDVTTASNEDLTLTVNGSGNFVFSGDFDSGITLGTAIANEFPLLVRNGIGNNAALVVDNLNNGDLFTASAAGTTRFTLANDGDLTLIGGNVITASSLDTITSAAALGISATTLTLGGNSAATLSTVTDDNLTLTANGTGDLRLLSDADTDILFPEAAFTTEDNSLLYTGASGKLFALTSTSAGQCVVSAAANNAPTWATCPGGVGGSSNWTLGAGHLTPNNNTVDLLVGGVATTSAKFAVLGVNSARGSQVASVSGSLGLDSSTASIQTTANQTLTIGGDKTGNITIAPNNGGAGSLLTINSLLTTLSGTTTLTASSLTSMAVGAAFTVNAANSYVRIGDTNSPGSATGDDDLFVESDLEVDGVIYAEGTIDTLFTGNNASVYGTVTSGVLASATTSTASLCLVSGAGGTNTPGWANCNTTGADTFWNQTAGAVHPNNSTVDLLVGGTASSSSKFAILGVNGTTPVASVSAQDANAAALYLDPANGALQAVKMRTLTLGGSTTGNIVIDSGSSSITLSDATTLAGNLTFSGTGNIVLAGGTISDGTDGVDINDDLDVSGAINLSTTNLAFSSTGGITFTGGILSDATDGVDVNDDLDVSGLLTISGGDGSSFAGGITFNDDVLLTLGGTEAFTVNNTTQGATDLVSLNSTWTGANAADVLGITTTYNLSTNTGAQYGLNLTNADNAGNTGVIDALALFSNDQATETLADGILLRHNVGSGVLTDAFQIENTTAGGTITNAINILETAGTITTALNIGTVGTAIVVGTVTTVLDSANLDISNAGAITGATGLALTSGDITLTGGTLSDATDGVDINDTLEVTGLISGPDLTLGLGDIDATISTADTDENLTIDPNGTGTLFFHGATYSLTSAGVLTVASCSGCGGGGGGTLQQTYDLDAGSDDAFILMDATGSIIFQTIAGEQFQVDANAAPTVDLMNINNTGLGTVTSAVSGLSIDFVQADDADGSDTNYGLEINLTAASADAGDILTALNLTVTGQTAQNREIGINIGTGFDEDIHFASGSAKVRMQDGGEIKFTDGSNNYDLPLGRFKEYFAGANYGVWEGGGFINIDGSFRMEQFLYSQANATADITAYTSRFGDLREWGLDEAGTGAGGTNTQQVGCVVRSGGDTNFTWNINGAVQILPDTTTVTGAMNNWCVFGMGGAASGTGTNATLNNFLQVANKFVMYYKVRLGSNITNSASNRYIWIGANNLTGGTTGRPANNSGIWFSNVNGAQTQTGTNFTAGTAWVGNVNNGTNATNYSTVACSGNNLNLSTGTSAWALMRIEARATNDVRFFIDSDVSNGIALTECGSGVTNNISTSRMKPSIMIANALTNNQTWDLIVDLFAYVQDDPRDSGGASLTGIDEVSSPPTPPDPILGADLAENYVMDGEFDIGDIVVLDEKPGIAQKSARPNDRKLLGVVSQSPGLTMGESTSGFITAPIALTGRVPVKVSSKNGPIKTGDPITSSDIPGVGVRAKTPGKIIGTAMENFDGQEGKILVNINVGYYIGDESDTALVEQPDEIAISSSSSGELNIGQGMSIDASASSMLTLDASSASSSGILRKVSLEEFVEIVGKIVYRGPIEYLDKVVFKGISEFIGQVVFRNSVSFDDEVVFNKDSAGYAEIKKGQKFVDVVFEKEYKNQPVINISPTVIKLTETSFRKYTEEGLCQELEGIEVCQDKIADLVLSDQVRYVVQNQTTQGFLIILSKEAPVDITFSWQAQSVKDVKTSKSDGPSSLALPFEGSYMPSNKFGEHSDNPAIKEKDIENGLKGHDGLDIGMPVGTDILAADEGEVEILNNDYGTTVYIKHRWGKTVYGHLSDTLVSAGERVVKGQRIALSGNSGLTTGPHLHFGIKLNSAKDNGYAGFANPMHYLSFGEPKKPSFAEASEGHGEVAGVAISPTPRTPQPTLIESEKDELTSLEGLEIDD